jgi:hypothetical protein
MFFIFYKNLSKRGHVRMTVLSYPDKSAIGFETYAEADEAGAELLKSGIDGCIWYEVRRIY